MNKVYKKLNDTFPTNPQSILIGYLCVSGAQTTPRAIRQMCKR